MHLEYNLMNSEKGVIVYNENGFKIMQELETMENPSPNHVLKRIKVFHQNERNFVLNKYLIIELIIYVFLQDISKNEVCCIFTFSFYI